MREGSRDFEVYFILSIIYKQRFRDYVLSANIPSDVFTEFDCRYVYEKILWLKQREKLITFFSVYETIRRDVKLADEKSNEICKILKPYIAVKVDLSFLESVVDGVIPEVEEMVKTRLAELALVKSTDLFDSKKLDDIVSLWKKVGYQAIYRKSNKISFWEAIRQGGSIKEMVGYHQGIPTGITGIAKNGDIDWLDRHFFFKGIGRGQLFILLGESNLGKTTFCWNMAMHQSLLGYNVDYYTMEVPKTYLTARGISMLTKIPTDDIIEDANQTRVQDKLAEIDALYPLKKDIQIYEEDPNALTIGNIAQNLMISQQEGRKVDMVWVDYLDLMRSERQYREKHYEVGQNAIDLRAMAAEFECGVGSPSQFGRSTFKDKKKKDKGRENIQGAYSKVYTADILIDCNSEIQEEVDYKDKAKEIELVRAYVDKNRYGKTSMTLTLRPDKATGRFFDPLPVVIKKGKVA